MTNRWVVERKLLHGQLASHIRDMIMEGVFKPGEKVNELDLCERFGVSRTPIREALRVLHAEGLVTIAPNRGAHVTVPTVEEVEELYPLIGALEGLAGELACERISDGQIASVRRLHQKMIANYRDKELVSARKINKAIHEAIFDAAGNASLSSMYRNLMIRTHSIRYFVEKSPEQWDQAITDHENIIEALCRREGSRLGEILREHLRRKIGMIKEALAELSESVPG